MKLQGRVLYFARVGKSLVEWLLSEAFRGLVENIGTQSVQELFFCDRSIRRTVYSNDFV